MKKILTKIILCFLLFFLWTSITSAINIINGCKTKWINISEENLYFKKNKYTDTARPICVTYDIWSTLIFKNNSDTFIITDKWIYNQWKWLDFVEILIVIYISFLFIILYFYHKYIWFLKRYKISRFIIKSLFFIILWVIVLSSIKYIIPSVLAWCGSDTYYYFNTYWFITLLFQLSFIKIWYYKSEQTKSFKYISKTLLFSSIFIIIFDSVLIYVNNIQNISITPLLIIWSLYIIYISYKLLKEIQLIKKIENCPKKHLVIYFVLLILLVSLIKPIKYFDSECTWSSYVK